MDSVVAKRLEGARPAQAGLIFLPVPGDCSSAPVVEAAPSQGQVLGYYPETIGQEEQTPRHYMVGFTTNGEAPDQVNVTLSGETVSPVAKGAIPGLEVAVIDRKSTGIVLREVDEVRITGTDATLGIRMGLETDEGVHWWEWVTPALVQTGEVFTVYRVGGYAPLFIDRDDEVSVGKGNVHRHPRLHHHNWVYCELHLVMFANGVIRIHARHINNRFFNRGEDLEGAVPVIGFTAGQGAPPTAPRDWEDVLGGELSVGAARLNLDDAATLCSPQQPGKMRVIDGVLHWKAYAGVEIYGNPSDLRLDQRVEKICSSENRVIPRGVARTVRLVASVGPAEPQIARYRVPSWYHATCGALWSDSALPVKAKAHWMVEAGAKWIRENMLEGCFEDGSVARSRRYWEDGSVAQSGWEGEIPYALMRYYYLTGVEEILSAALRAAYNLTDIATDHTDHAVLMHGRKMDARALPMQRVLGMIAGYLETGDAYLLETAQAVMDAAYWWDRTNWPRRAVGRDAAYVRGLVALFDVTGEGGYLKRAREAARRFTKCQLESGAFADQGGTVGIHANVNEVIKPWMNCIMSEALLDVADRTGDEQIEQSLLRLVGWLTSMMKTDERGQYYWGYKYRHGENPAQPWNPEAVFPVGNAGIQSYVLRLMMFAGNKTQDARFTDICLNQISQSGEGSIATDQMNNKRVEQGSWFDSHLLNPRWIDDALTLQPAPLPDATEVHGEIDTPKGAVSLQVGRQGDTLTVALDTPQQFDVHIDFAGKRGTILAGQSEQTISLDRP